MEYNFTDIEKRAKDKWAREEVYKVSNDSDKPKCYILDMFPYPSGAGLHVGHPLGYIASDIYARYKRQKGFNVLHPMGFDAFGLPAEQYAIETGQHPAVTTEKNIARYREQLDNIGFSFDWSRAVRTSDPAYYKWTQWIFLQLFHSWYDHKENKAKPVSELIALFEKDGNVNTPCPGDETLQFDTQAWKDLSEKEQRDHLMQYRIAYQGYAQVWWCEALGTVLANDEVVNGVSERGGHPVERKNMRQWFLRITEYADRLLASLDTLDWTDAMKEMQRNWIGKSNGAEVRFSLSPALSEGEGDVAGQDANNTRDLSPALSRGEGDVAQSGERDLTPTLSEGEGDVAGQDANNTRDLSPALSRGEGDVARQDANNTRDLSPALSRGEGDVARQDVNSTRDLSPALSKGEGDVAGHEKDKEENVTARDKQGWNTADGAVYNSIKGFRKDLKSNLTDAENRLWQELRRNNLGIKFRRQHVVGRFIVDFICLPYNLIVEIDGKIHEQQKTEDAQRTAYLEERGFKVIRFTNEQVLTTLHAVVEKIKSHLIPSNENREVHNISNEIRNISLSSGEGRGEVSRAGQVNTDISVFTTRPDTIFGVDFMVLAPEHELVDAITTPEQKKAIEEYKTYVKSRSERERMSEVKQVTGCFTGAYAVHPLTDRQIQVWISEYVLAGYGTGAIMGVPSGDERDHAFAKHFNIPITNIFGDKYTGEKAYSDKAGTIENSNFLSGMSIAEATEAAINELVDEGVGKRKVNYKLRDAGFSRQRYWGEPFPIMYVDDIPYGIDEPIIHNDWHLGHLPVELPMVEHYKPGPEGEGPLANIEDWVTTEAGQRETNTMPGYAGSSWYFLRYMDPHNDTEFASRKATDYWNQVDLYIGGNEHAVGHLLYSRMWTKVLYDLGHIGFDEPFKKMLNQGMIQGQSYFLKEIDALVYSSEKAIRKILTISYDNVKNYREGQIIELDSVRYKIIYMHPNGNRLRNAHFFVDSKGRITLTQLRKTYELSNYDPDDIEYRLKSVIWDGITENDEKFLQCHYEVEKMSKSKYNVVNPDDIVAQYGADTFRMYEMFLGPIDVSKPWDTKGIEGVYRFLKKMWRLYADEQKGWIVNEETPTDAELRILHKTIKKIGEDIERFSFNTSVSQFMICVNELTALGCHKRGILEPLATAICPFAPHIAEELWQKLGNTDSIVAATFPEYEERYVTDNTKMYPVAINGRTRIEMEFPLDAEEATVRQQVLADDTIQKWMEGREPKKFIYVKGKMINVVV